jgi:hypothetical protein
MPRANRYFLPGHVWHITHQCRSQFQWFDELTTNGIFQPLRSVPAVKELAAVQSSRFKVQGEQQTARTSMFREFSTRRNVEIIGPNPRRNTTSAKGVGERAVGIVF